MANIRVNYVRKIDEQLSEMPEFIKSYVYRPEQKRNYASKYQYVRDIADFLKYIIHSVPKYSAKNLSEITVEDLGRIDPAVISRYIRSLSEGAPRCYKPATVRRRRATLSSMYGYFLENRQVKSNPVLATEPVKVPDEQPVYLTNKEQRILLRAVRSGEKLDGKSAKLHRLYTDRDSALFLLMLDSGLRLSEIVTTDIADYDLEDCSVVAVRRGGEIDTVFYSNECRDYLKIYFEQQKEKYANERKIPAFTTSTGVRLGVRAVEALVKKYVLSCLPEKAGQISPQRLRSSFAMSLFEASGNDLLLLQKRMHHKSLQTTCRYAKSSGREVRKSRGLLQGKR